MQVVFTYIRKPVRLKWAQPGWGLPARGTRGEIPHPSKRAGRAGLDRAQRRADLSPPGKGSVCVPPFLLQLQEKRRQTGGKMEKQVCQAVPRSWRVSVVECGEARGETTCWNCCSLLKMACLFYKGCKATACFLCTAASVWRTALTSLTFRVHLIGRHLVLLGRFSNFLVSDGTKMWAETGKKAEMLWLAGWSSVNAQCYDPSMSGKRSPCLYFFLLS